jgi:hypothetical protein
MSLEILCGNTELHIAAIKDNKLRLYENATKERDPLSIGVALEGSKAY